MQAEVIEEKKIQRKIFRCSGNITYTNKYFSGTRPCRRILAESNEKGELHAKIICPKCGKVNEV